MDDLYLKSRIDDALERQLEPVRPEPAEFLAVGRRARRRRTTALSGLAVAAVAAVALGTAWLATSGLTRSDSDSAEMASEASARPASQPTAATDEASSDDFVVPRTDAELTTACRNTGYASATANSMLFDAGQAELVAKTSTPRHAWVLFESRGGALWGRCEIRTNLVEMAVFQTETDDIPREHNVETGVVCGGGDCHTEARLVAKLPPQVAEVRINFADNDAVLQPTSDGWIAITHLLELEAGRPAAERVTYFGPTGAVIAEYTDPSFSGQRVEGAPPLTAYPALGEGDRLNYNGSNYTD